MNGKFKVIKWSNNYLFNSSDPHSKCLFVLVHGKKVFHSFSVFRRNVAENSFLLGYYAESVGICISTFLEKVVPLSSSVYMSYRKNYLRSILLGNIDLRKTHRKLKVRALTSPETPGTDYHLKQRHITKERKFHLSPHRSL
jgi:hypothetical protein